MIKLNLAAILTALLWPMILPEPVTLAQVSQLAVNASPAGATSSSPAPASSAYLNPLAGMSLEQAVQYALTNNKNLLADAKLIAQAEGRLKQAGLKPNPMLDVSRTSMIGDASQGEVAVGVTLPLELHGRRARRVEVAERELERMRFEFADRQRRLVNEVRMKYGEVVEAVRNLELNERLLDLNRGNYTLVKARVSEGASAPLEQSLMSVEVSRIEATQVGYESRVAALIEELKNLIGMTSDEKLQIRDEFIERPVSLSREATLEAAFKSRPDLQSARAAEAVTEAMIEQAKTEGRFDMNLFAEYSNQGIGFDQLGLNHKTGEQERIFMRNNMVKAGVTITLPTRNRNQGNIETAIAMHDEAQLRREFIESAIKREIAAAYTRYEGAARVLKTFDTALLSAAQNNIRVVRSSYELGYARLNDVIAEQRRLIEVQMSYIEALKNYYLAYAELENAIGAGGKEK